ncbi:MAG: acyl-[acyl-carrier-protein] thioesterase [Wujia sp.]
MYSYNDRVSYSRIDKDGKLSIANTINAMQDACMFHNSAVGHSALELLKKERAWMVSSWHVIFDRRPSLDEEFSVDAWIYQMRGTFAGWNYVLKDTDGTPLSYADAKWFYANPFTGKPARIDEEERNAYEQAPAFEMDYTSRKIFMPDDMTYRYAIEVSPNYLDTNHHINNGQYIRLATDTLPMDCDVTELRAEYRMAARYGDTLHVYTKEDQGFYYVKFTDGKDITYFTCECRL